MGLRLNPSRMDYSPIALAYTWVGRIFAICGEMILPCLGGLWLDQKLGTRFLSIVGLMLGLVLGTIHLIAIASAENSANKQSSDTAHRERLPPTRDDSTDDPGK
jgi:hypothetical protein